MSLTTALKLSRTQGAYLIDHINGTRPIICNQLENPTRNALIRMQLIKYNTKGGLSVARPDGTVLTDPFGRETVCALLGYYADELIRGGCLEARPPIDPKFNYQRISRVSSEVETTSQV